jgi:lycopene cyclase domain-containing protein
LPNNLEYIAFNLLVLAGPLVFSFDRQLNYFRHWPRAATAILAFFPLYVGWDLLVTGRHWWFNPEYTQGTYIARLPLGEYLFFLTVPFASLFVWEVLRFYLPGGDRLVYRLPAWWSIPGLFIALLLIWQGRLYTALATLVLAVLAGFDLTVGGQILRRRNAWLYAGLLTLLMLIFNGYLTARPVVLYDPRYQLGVRIWTIPVEDFLYGFGLVLGCTSLYEKLGKKI